MLQNMVLSRLIYSILAVLLLFTLYMIYFQESEFWRWAVIPIVFLGIMNYVFQPQIDSWWFERTEATLDPKEHHFLENKMPFYQSLSPKEQEAFGRECMRFNHHVEYILKGIPSFPDDLKVMVAAHAISLKYAFGLSDENPFHHFERIAFYPHPFISPDIDEVHASESHFEDGVWIFSLEQFLLGITQSHRYFNICLYEMARVLLSEKPSLNEQLLAFSQKELDDYRRQFSDIPFERIQKFIHLEEIDIGATYITALIMHWDKVSGLSQEERMKIPLGNALHHLDVLFI